MQSEARYEVIVSCRSRERVLHVASLELGAVLSPNECAYDEANTAFSSIFSDRRIAVVYPRCRWFCP